MPLTLDHVLMPFIPLHNGFILHGTLIIPHPFNTPSNPDIIQSSICNPILTTPTKIKTYLYVCYKQRADLQLGLGLGLS